MKRRTLFQLCILHRVTALKCGRVCGKTENATPENTVAAKAFIECCDSATNWILCGDGRKLCDGLQMFVTNEKSPPKRAF
jgi:hypothetical protein